MFFQSSLIVCSDFESALPKIGEIFESLGHKFNTNNPDIFQINQETGWSIDSIRQIKKFFSQKPFNHQSKIVVIENCENLNIESQNAILKTLEEPGPNNYLILVTSKKSSLLPTIISRCHTIKIVSQSQKTKVQPITISNDLVENLNESERLSSKKEGTLTLLETQLALFQQQLVENPKKETSFLIQKIIKAINMINSNVDPKSALDFVFLS